MQKISPSGMLTEKSLCVVREGEERERESEDTLRERMRGSDNEVPQREDVLARLDKGPLLVDLHQAVCVDAFPGRAAVQIHIDL
jgi:hypothetical protein